MKLETNYSSDEFFNDPKTGDAHVIIFDSRSGRNRFQADVHLILESGDRKYLKALAQQIAELLDGHII